MLFFECFIFMKLILSCEKISKKGRQAGAEVATWADAPESATVPDKIFTLIIEFSFHYVILLYRLSVIEEVLIDLEPKSR